MEDNLFKFYGALYLALHIAGATGTTLEYTVCYEWEAPGSVILNCNSDQIIHIKSVKGGRQQTTTTSSNFCQNPRMDENNDCFQRDRTTENWLFQQCNYHSNCELTLPFLNMDECSDMGYEGQKYFYIEYECLSRNRHGAEVLFQPMQDLRPDTFARTSYFHLLSENYPNYVRRSKTVCELSIAGQTNLAINILEIRGRGSDSCPYMLKLNDNKYQFTKCAEELWNDNMNNEFEYRNSESGNKTIQIAFERQRTVSTLEGKLWLQFQTFSLASNMEENQGIVDLSCDHNAAIWPRPANQQTTTTTSTTTSTSATAPPSSSTTDASRIPDPDEILKEKSKEDKNMFLPIIGGVVAGGLVILVIIIIIIVLLVRRYHINHKPAKSLEVIDAWDDASTLSKKNDVGNYSNGSVNYDPASTASTSISPYETNSPSPRQSYMMNGEIYAEIPELRASRGQSNHGYIFEDDLYNDSMHHGGNKVLMNGSSILAGSLDRRRVSELYAKPNKPHRKPGLSTSTVSSGGFDNPDISGDLYEAAHRLDLQEDIYGYSTSLA